MDRCGVYLAQAMTGQDRHEQVTLAKLAVEICEAQGLRPLSPVLEEKIKDEAGPLENTGEELDGKWRGIDKPALKHKCFVLCVLNADLKSFGCEREYMLMRGAYWQPAVIVSPRHANGYISIANFEDDYIAGSITEAAAYINQRWGTWPKRFIWKVKVLCKMPKWLLLQLSRLFQ